MQKSGDNGRGSTGSSTNGKYATWTLVGTTAVCTAALVPFLLVPWLPKRVFGALPWMKTPSNHIDDIFLLLQSERGSKRGRFIDFGSGDGCAVIGAAQRGYDALGIELNPVLFAYSYLKSWRWQYSHPDSPFSAKFVCGNMFHTPIASADVIMCFGVPSLMPRLARKIRSEAKDGALVVLYRFHLSDWKPIAQKGLVRIYQHRVISENISNTLSKIASK